MNDPTPFWSALGTAASVDWCEPNYVYSHLVAEWWNTLSSLTMVVLGVQGALRVRSARDIERRFLVCFLLVAVVGLGSMAFHGTILKVAQAMDELPMVYGGLGYAYCLANRRHTDSARARRWQLALGAYAALFTAAYFSLEAYFTFFVATYSVLMAVLILGGARVAWGPTGSSTHRRLLVAAAGPFVAAFLFFWLPEHVLLACDHAIQALQLHAWWHIGAGLGAYLGTEYLLWDRLQQRGQAPELRRWFGLPVVMPGERPETRPTPLS